MNRYWVNSLATFPEPAEFQASLDELAQAYTFAHVELDNITAEQSELEAAGVWSQVPTWTQETQPGRPGVYYRLVFSKGATEWESGRRHYIGNKSYRIHSARQQCARTERYHVLGARKERLSRALKAVAVLVNQATREIERDKK